jgi:hypothetical protein
LEKIITTYAIMDRLMFNFDETWLNGEKKNLKSAKLQGDVKNVRSLPKEMDEHFTLGLVCNASGDSHSHFKPLLICPAKSVPAASTQAFAYFNFSCSDEGWITASILHTWIQVFTKQLDKYKFDNGISDRYSLLILDNHSSRNGLNIDKLFLEHKLVILFIPPHSSALLQPLDLNPNGVFKKKYFELESRYLALKPEEEPLDAAERRNRRIVTAGRCLSVALSEDHIRTGWERACLWPISKEVILESKMILPYVEGLPPPPPGRKTRKRGPTLAPGDILVNGTEIVNANPEPPKKKKKLTKQEKADMLTVVEVVFAARNKE